MARDTSAVDAPDASIMLFIARPSVVASSRLEQRGASCCTMLATWLVELGRPSRLFWMRWIEADASSAEYPRLDITLGKLFSVSTREIAALREFDTALNAPDAAVATSPASAPAFAENPLLYDPPALWPAFWLIPLEELKALVSCLLMFPVRLSNRGVRSTEPLATSAIACPLSACKK